MTGENLIHCSALLMINFRGRESAKDPRARGHLIQLARNAKRAWERRPARGFRDEEPGVGVFLAFDSGLRLADLMRERGFEFPSEYLFEDQRRDVCFHLKYAPGRRLKPDQRGTRYEILPCEIGDRTPLELFQSLRREILEWTDPAGSPFFDLDTEIFLVGARPLPMLEMFTVLQPHHFIDAFPEYRADPAGPQAGNLLFVQLQKENLSEWIRAGAASRRRSMGGLFTSTVMAPGDSYSLELARRCPESGPANIVEVDEELARDPRGLGYMCRIHDGFTVFHEHEPFRIEMRESFLPGIERSDIVMKFCRLREAEMAAIKFTGPDDAIRISRGGIPIADLPLRGARSLEQDGLVGEARFDPEIPKLTIRLPFLFFPDLEIPPRLLDEGVVIEWINEHREEARHTISFWSGEHNASHRSQALKAISGRLMVNAPYLSSGQARAGMDNVLVYRDDFSLDAAKQNVSGAADAMRLGNLQRPFNSIFTGRTPDTDDARSAFVEMMISLLRRDGTGHAGAKLPAVDEKKPAGIAPFVMSQYSFIFREPVIADNE
ncbi:MAG: hypothetical protein DMF61_01540 [Blastocatellia bacterium AA13]|nr:MAG: hypothetical protein DMF61_01540 [Blastocatellia bacterium AA13]